MIRLFLTAALSCALALPALAAQPAEGEKLAENQDYAFRLSDAITTLDPQKTGDSEGAEITRQLFEGLLNQDAAGAPVPGVATGFELSEDRRTYTFHLRPEARWSNGDPVTAADFVHAWRRLADPATGSEYAWFIELMHVENASAVVKGRKKPEELGVKAVDDHTLAVRLTVPTPYFPKLVTHGATFPVNRASLTAGGDDWNAAKKLVGNGAYVLKSHELGVQIGMEKNPRYWDAAHVVMAHVKALTVTDADAALSRYEAGELDRVPIPAGQYASLRQRFPDQAVSIPRSCTYAYLFNLGDKGPKALKDLRVRKALSYAMPRETVVRQILQDGQRPAYGWTPGTIEGFLAPEPDQAGWTPAERLDKARALLAEAGYGPGKPLKLTLTFNGDETHEKIALAAQQAYAQLGVELALDQAAWKIHADRLQAGDFQLARYGWCADYDEASSFLDYFRATGLNYGRYANPEFDSLMDQSRTAPDPNRPYAAAERILAEDMPLIPIYHYAGAELIRDDIRGLPTAKAPNAWYAKDLYRIRK
ncbi:peptide ABC transporter substrate-binding protein [Paracoccus aminovorans]|uniref:peptide ABC transporter substrate-binding protein n=1 Tax=Paracoccus aminovorans TaxID=34004 RepID=UPI002B25FE70|nr:peptide ABC transporter substrate-binding protein [Paracoccus aminovorans]